MSLFRLVLKNIAGNAFRSLAVFLCALLVASMVLVATFVVRGAEASLRLNLKRLGADLLVLPWGTMTDRIGGVRLMSAEIDGWMPRAHLATVAGLPGVDQVSPQLHLASIQDSLYSSRPEVYLVAYDPATDFTLAPWLEGGLPDGLGAGQVVAGARITIPDGERELALFGYPLQVADRLEPTATSIDDTIFVSFETADQMIAWTRERGIQGIDVMPGSFSAILVKVSLDVEPHQVTVEILENMRGVVPLETPGLFQAERRQMIGVLRTMLGLLGLIWVLTLVFLGLVFAVTANERRWEIGVLRAIGLSRSLVLQEFMLEGAALALAGGLTGVVAAIVGLFAASDRLVQAVRLPLQYPSPLGLVLIAGAGLAMALLSVALAALLPAWQISHQEVAFGMRE